MLFRSITWRFLSNAVGTPDYMAPEQMRGIGADHRADIFALGAILYEMLSGERAFRAETAADAMTAILTGDPPPLSASGRQIPPGLVRVVERCLEKEPAARFQSTRDLAFALEGASSQSESGTALVPPKAQKRMRWRVAAAGLSIVAVVAMVMGAVYLTSRPAQSPVRPIRFAINAPAGSSLVASTRQTVAVISGDGRRVAFIASRQGGTQMLWVRALDELEPRALAGTQGAYYPFWSPDGESIGFFASTKLKTVAVDSGQVQTIADVQAGVGASWNQQGIIIFSPSTLGGVFQVPADRKSTRLNSSHVSESRMPSSA